MKTMEVIEVRRWRVVRQAQPRLIYWLDKAKMEAEHRKDMLAHRKRWPT